MQDKYSWLDEILDNADERAIGMINRPIEEMYRNELKAKIIKALETAELEGRIIGLKIYKRAWATELSVESYEGLETYIKDETAKLKNISGGGGKT